MRSRRLLSALAASQFAQALWGSSLLHLAALAGLLVWVGAAHQIPGGGGRGGMQLDLSPGDGAPFGPLKMELLGDPESPPLITPWAKNVDPNDVVVAPPPLTEVSTPGAKDLPESNPEKTASASSSASKSQTANAKADQKPTTAEFGPRAKTDLAVTPASASETESTSSAASSLSSSTASKVVESGGGSPVFIGNLPPHYPDVAVQNRWEGDVMLLLHIDTKGRVVEVEILHGSGHDVLDDEAAAAIRHWIGKPANRNGVPVESTAQLPVHFRLK